MAQETAVPAGWSVPVQTQRIGVGRPMLVVYGVALADREEAIAKVAAMHLKDGDEIGNPGPLTQATLDSYDMHPGDVRMF